MISWTLFFTALMTSGLSGHSQKLIVDLKEKSRSEVSEYFIVLGNNHGSLRQVRCRSLNDGVYP